MVVLAVPVLVGAQDIVDWDKVDVGLSRRDLIEVVNAVIRIVLSFLGIIAVVIILIGGFNWMTSGGSQEKIDGARKAISAGAIGLVIIFTAYAIAYFVIEQLASVTAE